MKILNYYPRKAHIQMDLSIVQSKLVIIFVAPSNQFAVIVVDWQEFAFSFSNLWSY